jgi:hypothetical protein
VFGYQRLELGAECGVLTERELRIDPLLDRVQAQVLETLNLQSCERFELQIGQRPAAPHRLRLAHHHRGVLRIVLLQRATAVGDVLFERLQVQLPWLDAKHVPGRAREQPRIPVAVAAGERLTKTRDLHAKRLLGAVSGQIAQQRVDQPLARHDPAGVAQKQRQQRPLPRPADSHRRIVEQNLQRPENPELKARPHLPPAILPQTEGARHCSRTAVAGLKPV